MEVVQGIHRIEVPLGERFVCLYLLLGDEHALLVDTGLDTTPGEMLVPYLDSLGVEREKIRYVLNTHADFDHTGGNASLRELVPGAVVMCHELDRPMIESVDRLLEERYGEFAVGHGIDESAETKAWIQANARGIPVDLGLRGGERIRLGPNWHVDILHTPGHSRGHVSVRDPRSHSMIIADAALWNTILTKEGAPAFPPTYRYVDTYRSTIHWLQAMPIDTLLTSHYPIYRGAAVAEFLGESRTFTDQVDDAVRDELSRAGTERSMKDLIQALAPRLGHWPDGSEIYLVYPLQGHLERLLQHGLIAARQSGEHVAWRWAG